MLTISGCAVDAEDGVPPPWLDTGTPPPGNEIVPPHGIFLGDAVQPLTAGFVAGEWQLEDCTLALSGDGLRGRARLSGPCPEELSDVSTWQIAPDGEIRLALADAAGAEVWAGVATRHNRLEGFTRSGLQLHFTR